MKRRIQDLFGNDFSLFLSYCQANDGFSIRHGFDVPQDLWAANPEIVFN